MLAKLHAGDDKQKQRNWAPVAEETGDTGVNVSCLGPKSSTRFLSSQAPGTWVFPWYWLEQNLKGQEMLFCLYVVNRLETQAGSWTF